MLYTETENYKTTTVTTQPLEASGNSPKSKQQMKKYLFMKNYEKLVIKLEFVVFEPRLLPVSSLPPLQLREVETPLQTAVAKNTGHPLPAVPSQRASFLA